MPLIPNPESLIYLFGRPFQHTSCGIEHDRSTVSRSPANCRRFILSARGAYGHDGPHRIEERSMAVLLVTYDLNKPGQDYLDVLNVIKSFSWARLSESSYVIATEFTPAAVMDKLRPFLDPSDNIYVITLKRPYAGFGPKAVNEWLEKFLPW
jgi:hypothetical protein